MAFDQSQQSGILQNLENYYLNNSTSIDNTSGGVNAVPSTSDGSGGQVLPGNASDPSAQVNLSAPINNDLTSNDNSQSDQSQNLLNATPGANATQNSTNSVSNNNVTAATLGLNQIPISQQSYSMQMPDLNPHMPPIGNTYVPGIGVLGPDLGGAVKGVQALQDYRLKEATNIRANEELGLDKTKVGMLQNYMKMAEAQLGISLDKASQDRQNFDFSQNTQQGMINAAKTGGYAGVINWLAENNPAMALTFHATKLSIDDSILKNKVMQAQAPNEINQAMINTYGLGGKMMSAIANAPASIRPQMWQQMQPILKPIYGDSLPNTYGPEAQGFGALAIAQGAPENIAYLQNGLAAYQKSEVGQAYQSAAYAGQAYGMQSPQYMSAIAHVKALDNQATQTAIKAQQTTQSMTNDNDKMHLSWNNGLQNDSKDFNTNMGYLQQLGTDAQTVQDSAKNGEVNNEALSGLKIAFARLNNGSGRLPPQVLHDAAVSVGAEELSKNVESYLSGKEIALTPPEAQQVVAIAGALQNNVLTTQTNKEKQWMSAGPQDMKWVLPTQNYANNLKIQMGAGTASSQASQAQNMSKEAIDTMAQQAIQQGKDPNAVGQMVQTLYKQNGVSQ